MNNAVYIPSLDAKDIYVSNNYIVKNDIGYNLKNSNGTYNLKKFVNTLDYSLDLIKLKEVYYKTYRNHKFAFTAGRHQYSTHVINVTFKYSNKEFNQIRKNIYIRFGYSYKDVVFIDGACIKDGKLIAIQTDTPIKNPIDLELLENNFKFENNQYKVHYIKTLNTRFELREELYKNGFICDGIKYVRMKRSSGSARVGKCLFINEKLYKAFHKWESWGLKIKEGQEIDLAAFESYISLPTSSIIDTIEIQPKNILVIDDYESVFTDDCIATSVKNNQLHTEVTEATIKNSIWDGQSLIDKSLMGSYDKHGMILLRNGFFKSCCFNCNIQQWFKDNNITSVEQLNGFTLAENIEDVLLITTPNSIKYLKFGSLEQWLDVISPMFGVVKHDKKTHFFEGKLVQTHYQLLNTLQLSYDETKALLKPSFDFLDMATDDSAVLRYFVKYPITDALCGLPIQSKNDIVFKLMGINDRFYSTSYYSSFKSDLFKSFKSNIKRGHILVNGNYSTLLGNPMEMLSQTLTNFNGVSQLGIGNIHSTRFGYNKEILGSRSPHVCASNVLVVNNVADGNIDKYFNLTDEIVCINSIGENILQRLNGADFDSDTVLLTDNEILLKAAKRNYDIFKVPTCMVEAKKTKRYYTAEQQADLDIKTSVNKIGEIINFSQILNTLYWDNLHKGQTHEENLDLFLDIAQLSVMSGIEIDKAKKEFVIDNTQELNKLREKYADILNMDSGKTALPYFFAHISRLKGYYNPEKKDYIKHHTTMDYVQTICNGYHKKYESRKSDKPFVYILNKDKYRVRDINQEQLHSIILAISDYYKIKQSMFMDGRGDEPIDALEKMILPQQKCLDLVSKNKIGYSTMYTLLSLLDVPQYSHLKNTMIEILFKCPNSDFYSVIKESTEDMEIVYQVDDNPDFYIFGVGFKKCQKNADFHGDFLKTLDFTGFLDPKVEEKG